tara:strand:+ start:270 stop:497 length:228 start_codon:yes stop_codon:yes gene_type:complete
VIHQISKKIKSTDIKRNFAGYSESFGGGKNKIHIYKDLTIKDWRVVWHYGMYETAFNYKNEAVEFINSLIQKQNY